MQVQVRKAGHCCDKFYGTVTVEHVGKDLRQEFKDVRRVRFPPSMSHSIKSITIDKRYLFKMEVGVL